MLTLVSVLGFSFASLGQAVTPDDARAIRDTVNHAKAVVDRAISGADSRGAEDSRTDEDTRNPNRGPGPSPWEVTEDVILENDYVALPIYQQASNNLFTAGSYADQAIFALAGINPQEGAFLFAQSCAKMGISRSQIARANLAAIQPPAGYLAAFGPELEEVVVELNALHTRCN